MTDTLALTLLASLGGVVVLAGALYGGVRAMVMRAYGDALVAATGDVLLEDRRANCGGLSSKPNAVRGIGPLLLTRKELLFALGLPRRLVRIPLDRIEQVDESRTHARRANAVPMLRVTWRREDGTVDRCAWHVADRVRWLAELERVVERGERLAEPRGESEKTKRAGAQREGEGSC